MESFTIDINVDVGEGVGNESLLLPNVSSCNIACGGHAGDVNTMREVIKLCKTYNVKIGGHPSFPDKTNFGRLPMDISCANLYTSIKHQLRSLMKVLREERAVLHHIKPHGALYNLAATDERIAAVVIEVVKSIALPVKLYVPFGSVIEEMADKESIPFLYEAFADRNYNEDLTLVSRTSEHAIISESSKMFDHVIRMITQSKVKTVNGVEVEIKANTFCVHGDHPNAEKLLLELSQKLVTKNIRIL